MGIVVAFEDRETQIGPIDCCKVAKAIFTCYYLLGV